MITQCKRVNYINYDSMIMEKVLSCCSSQHLWKPLDFLPGHGTSLLQSSTSLEYPAHFFPPYCAAGESHFRALEYFPCLQVLLQALHWLQLPHIPSTKGGEVEVILALYINLYHTAANTCFSLYFIFISNCANYGVYGK